MTTDTPYTTGEVARLFNVDASTVARWAVIGKLPYFRTPGGQRRFPREAIDALVASAA